MVLLSKSADSPIVVVDKFKQEEEHSYFDLDAELLIEHNGLDLEVAQELDEEDFG